MLQGTRCQKVLTLKVLGIAVVLALAVAGGGGGNSSSSAADVIGSGGPFGAAQVGVTPPATNVNIAVVRLNGDGSLDPSFGEGVSVSSI